MNKSIETLKLFNAWRTGEDDRTMDEAGIVPSEVTKAINEVIEQHKELYRLLDRAKMEIESLMDTLEDDTSTAVVDRIKNYLERIK